MRHTKARPCNFWVATSPSLAPLVTSGILSTSPSTSTHCRACSDPPLGWQTLYRHPSRCPGLFRVQVGKALASSMEDTSWAYSRELCNDPVPLTMDLQTHVLYGKPFPYCDQLAKAGFSWCPPSWRFLIKDERRARRRKECERDAELARQAQETLELDPECQEQQRLLRAGEAREGSSARSAASKLRLNLNTRSNNGDYSSSENGAQRQR